MKSSLDCVPCFFAQAIRAARLAGLDRATTRQLLDDGQRLPEIDDDLPPPANAGFIYRRLAELAGTSDPFAGAKKQHTATALELVPSLRAAVAEASDPLDAALRVAVAGNVIDLGASDEIGNLDEALQRALTGDHPRWEVAPLSERLARASTLLVIGDNAGEAVFDRVLLETLGRLQPRLELTYAVRGAAVINDATEEDARAAGIDRAAELVTTGSDIPGVMIDQVDPLFRARLVAADVVLSKGQGNFETLSEATREVFFLLAIKCRVVATNLGLPRGSSALIWSAGEPSAEEDQCAS